jgi:hypothetical protein
VSAFGAANTRDLVHNRSLTVVKKTDGQVSTHNQHHYVQHADDSLTEIARQVYTTDAAGDTAQFTLGSLRTLPDGTQELGTALKVTEDGVMIGEANLDEAGRSFDTAAGAVYFGGRARKWRIIMTEEVLAFKYKIADASYVPKVLMTKEE